MSHDFRYEILDEIGHRPWPMPAAPWIMTQTWHDLLFAHWPVDADRLRSKMPPGLPLDLHHGQAWIGIVPFRMTNVAPRFVPALEKVACDLYAAARKNASKALELIRVATRPAQPLPTASAKVEPPDSGQPAPREDSAAL